MKEHRIKISYKELIDLLRYGKTQNKFDLQVEEVEYDSETEQYVNTGMLDVVDFIEVGE